MRGSFTRNAETSNIAEIENTHFLKQKWDAPLLKP